MKTMFAVIGFSFLIAGCAIATPAPPLPTPEAHCPMTLDWHGLVAGRSTRQEVVQVLGNPTRQGNQQFDGRRVSYYAYNLAGGSVASFAEDQVFFLPNGIVDWMQVVVADRDGEFHTVPELADQVGYTLDTVYWNNNYNPANQPQCDVLAGPDQLYVWSECGVILDVLPFCTPTASGGLKCSGVSNSLDQTSAMSGPLKLRQRSPDPVDGALDVTNSTILMKILIPPTSYDGFKTTYMYKIPFGRWDDYVNKVLWHNP